MTAVATRTREPRHRAADARDKAVGLVILTPALVFLTVFVVTPIIRLVLRSLQDGPDGGLTTGNYAAIFTEPALQRSLRTTVTLSIVTTAITLALCTPAALRLARGGSKGVMDAAVSFPLALPGIVIGFFTIVLLGRTGLIGQVWEPAAGASYTYVGLTFAYVYFCVPRVVGTLRGAVSQLPPDIDEAAATLGARPRQVYWTVKLPLLIPAMVEAGGVCMATSLGAYGTAATLSEGIRVLPLDVADALTVDYNVTASAAMAITLAVLAVGFLVLGERFAASLARRRGVLKERR